MAVDNTKLLIPPEFFFQATFAVGYCSGLEPAIRAGKHPQGLTRLPQLQFAPAQKTPDLQVSCGWNDAGLAVNWELTGKSQPQPSDVRPAPGDSMTLYIDTRDLKSNRRATRFCHRFQVVRPLAVENIPRLKRLPFAQTTQELQPVPAEQHAILITASRNSYRISCWLGRDLLTGFDPENVPSLGFDFTFFDTHSGNAWFGLGPEFPIESDPSLWPSLKLVR